MNTLDDIGLEYIKHPVKKIRVHYHAGLWYVEYQREPKYLLDKWWWFDDSKHAEYKDAFARAQEITNDGGIRELRHKKLVFTVETNN